MMLARPKLKKRFGKLRLKRVIGYIVKIGERPKGVRVKIKIKTSKKSIETSALVNTGFEAEHPEILIPTKLAERA